MITKQVQATPDCKLTVDVLSGDTDGFLLVHGLASNARMWDGVAKQLNKSGFRVAIVDQRGHGRSEKISSGYDFDTISADLHAVINDLSNDGFRTPIVVGQSWGAAVVESFAKNYPTDTRGIVAVDGGMTALGEKFPEWEECKKILSPPNMLGHEWERFETMVRSTHSDWPEVGISGVLANMEKLPDGTLRPWLSRENHLQILWNLWQHNPYEICANIQVPILFVPAGGDPLRDMEKREGLERLSRVAKASKTIWFEHSHHDIHAQFPNDLAKLLIDERTAGIFS